jgi:mono/diheme cytochrome c family protein
METARWFLVLLVPLGFAVVLFAEGAEQTGEALFKQNCSTCHSVCGVHLPLLTAALFAVRVTDITLPPRTNQVYNVIGKGC